MAIVCARAADCEVHENLSLLPRLLGRPLQSKHRHPRHLLNVPSGRLLAVAHGLVGQFERVERAEPWP